jgi:soluble lytic murein transglycosylase-like protein
MASIFVNIKAVTAGATAALKAFTSTLTAELKRARAELEAFNKLSAKQQQTASAGLSGTARAMQGVGNAAVGFTSRMKGAFSTLTSFNTVARVGTSAARAIGTSMIFAGGAFRDLGVGINVAASLFQSFIPIISSVAEAIGPVAYLLVPFAVHLTIVAAELGVIAATMYSVAQAGMEFNSVMETTQISIATLITQFRDMYQSMGSENGVKIASKQIGALKELTDEQIKNSTATERDIYVKQQAASINEKLQVSLLLAKDAFRTLTVEAAQSPFTTLELSKGFQAVTAVMGQYNISLKDTAKLTVTLGRVASVAGVSGAQLASQFTLFLSGAGRITSPLARFASQIGLTKDKIKELRKELEAAKDSPEKTAAIVAVLTTRLAAFDNAGQLIATSWQGIMSNMEESFQLFAGAVTEGMFTTIRDAFMGVVPDVDTSGKKIYEIYDSTMTKIGEKVEGTFTHIEGQTEKVKTKVVGFLSQIFDYDDKGFLKTNINSIADVFQQKLQPAISVIKDIFTFIGKDVASILQAVADKITDIAVYIGNNRDKVFEMYGNFKLVLFSIWEIIKAVLSWFGVTDDVNESVLSINNSLAGTTKTLEGIRTSASFIRWIFNGILVIADLLGIAIGGILEGIWNILHDIAYLFGQVTGLYNMLPTNWFSRTSQSVQDLKNAWTDAGKAYDDMQGSSERELKIDQKRLEINNKLTERLNELATKRSKVRAESPANIAMSDAQLDSIISDREAKAEKDKINGITMTPRKTSGEGDADKKKAKRLKVYADLEKSTYKEVSQVLKAELDFRASLIERSFDLLSERLSQMSDEIKNKLARNEISFLSSNSTILNNTIAGIQGEIAERKKLEDLRLIAFKDSQNNITQESKEKYAQNQRDIQAAKESGKSAVEVQNIVKKGALEQEQLRLQAAQEMRQNYTQQVKYSTEQEKLEMRIAKAVSDANQERLMYLRKIGDEAVNTLAALEEKSGTGTKQQELALEVSSRERITELSGLERDYINKIAALEKESATLTGTKLTLNRFALKDTKNGLTLIQDTIAAQLKLNEIAKIELRLQQEQNKLSIQQYQLDLDTAEIKRRSESGRISETKAILMSADAAERYQEATRENIQSLANMAAWMREHGQELGAIEIEKNIEAWRRLGVVQDEAAATLRGTFRSGFEGFFDDIQSNITDVGSAFANLGKSILGTFQKLISKRLSEKLFESLFGNGLNKDEKGYKKGIFGDIFDGLSAKLDLGNAERKPLDNVVGDSSKVILDAESGGKTALTNATSMALSAAEVVNKAAKTLETVNGLIKNIESNFEALAATLERAKALIPNWEKSMDAAGREASESQFNIGTNLGGMPSTGRGSLDKADKSDAQSRVEKALKSKYANFVIAEAKRQGLDPALALTIMGIESNSVDNLTSPTGNYGLFQLGGDLLKKAGGKTGGWQKNVSVGIAELKKNLAKAGGDFTKLIGSYNIGADAFNRSTDSILRASNIPKTSPNYANRRNIYNGSTEEYRDKASLMVQLLNQRGIGQTPNFNPASTTDVAAGQVVINTANTDINPSIAAGLTTNSNASNLPKTTDTDALGLTNNTPSNAGISNADITTIKSNFTTLLSYFTPNVLEATRIAVASLDTKLDSALSVTLSTMTESIKATITLEAGNIVTAIGQISQGVGAFTGADGEFAEGGVIGRIKRAWGGFVSGPGGSTEDKIPAWLSNGEFVVKAAAVKALGLKNLHAINNADRQLPKLAGGGTPEGAAGGGGFFSSIASFLSGSSGMGKGILSILAPFLISKIFGKKAGEFAAMGIPILMQILTKAFAGGMAGGGLIQGFDGGGVAAPPRGASSSGGGGGIGWGAVIQAGLAIGMALLNRLFAKKTPKSDPNRTKDPFGLNPDTLTYYKHPIISGVRNYLAKGGMPNPNLIFAGIPRNVGGAINVDNIGDIVAKSMGGGENYNIKQNININTPDIHSFKNSKGQIQRDLARYTQGGLKRKTPKY